MARKSERPVEVPRRDDDHPAWMRVGIIAAIGFIVGTAWPKLTDTRLAPRPPSVNREVKAAKAKAAASPNPSTAPRPTPSASASPPTEKPPERASAKVELAKIVAETAQIRRGPGSKMVVTKLARGEKVHIVARKEKWLRVRYGEGLTKEGWVFAKSVGN